MQPNSVKFSTIQRNSDQLNPIQSRQIQSNSIQLSPIQSNSVKISKIHSNSIKSNSAQFNCSFMCCLNLEMAGRTTKWNTKVKHIKTPQTNKQTDKHSWRNQPKGLIQAIIILYTINDYRNFQVLPTTKPGRFSKAVLSTDRCPCWNYCVEAAGDPASLLFAPQTLVGLTNSVTSLVPHGCQ